MRASFVTMAFGAVTVSGMLVLGGGCTRDQLHSIFPAEIEQEDYARLAAARQSGPVHPTTEPSKDSPRTLVDVGLPDTGLRPVTIIDTGTGGTVNSGGMGNGGYSDYGEDQY